MPRILTAAALCFMALDAAADSPPKAYTVGELSAGDHLNVRAGPSGGAEDIGDLAAGAGPLDVLSVDPSGAWGRIHWGERDGWVALRYLTPAERAVLGRSGAPIGLLCLGTEPFWSVEIGPDALTLDIPGETPPPELAISSTKIAAGRLTDPVRITAAANATMARLTVRAAACSDGMSDLTYGWTADLGLEGEGLSIFATGCCKTPSPGP